MNAIIYIIIIINYYFRIFKFYNSNACVFNNFTDNMLDHVLPYNYE